MNNNQSIAMQFSEENDVSEVRDLASAIASDMGFGNTKCAEVSLAVSEIVGNTVKYAGNGNAIIRLSGNKKCLEIIIQDNGSGIKSIKNAMREGYSSSATSFGVGLNAANRAMDEFSIISKNGNGTRVLMKKYLVIPDEEIEYGIISLNDERYPVNGDAFLIKEYQGDKTLLAVIDGAGNGYNANRIANFVKNIIEQNYKSKLTTIATSCHKKMRQRFESSQVRNCAMGLLLLKPRSMEFLGVGDIGIDIMDTPEKIHMLSERGTVGDIKQPNLKLKKYRCGRKIIVIMCSDGIRQRFTEDELPLDKHAQDIANYIMRNYRCEYGDATVLVAKRKK